MSETKPTESKPITFHESLETAFLERYDVARERGGRLVCRPKGREDMQFIEAIYIHTKFVRDFLAAHSMLEHWSEQLVIDNRLFILAACKSQDHVQRYPSSPGVAPRDAGPKAHSSSGPASNAAKFPLAPVKPIPTR